MSSINSYCIVFCNISNMPFYNFWNTLSDLIITLQTGRGLSPSYLATETNTISCPCVKKYWIQAYFFFVVVSFCFITKWISYTYTHVPISPPSCISLPPTLPIPPTQAVTKHWADLPVLCGCFPLAISFTFGSVYMSMTLSHSGYRHTLLSQYWEQVKHNLAVYSRVCLM